MRGQGRAERAEERKGCGHLLEAVILYYFMGGRAGRAGRAGRGREESKIVPRHELGTSPCMRTFLNKCNIDLKYSSGACVNNSIKTWDAASHVSSGCSTSLKVWVGAWGWSRKPRVWWSLVYLAFWTAVKHHLQCILARHSVLCQHLPALDDVHSLFPARTIRTSPPPMERGVAVTAAGGD